MLASECIAFNKAVLKNPIYNVHFDVPKFLHNPIFPYDVLVTTRNVGLSINSDGEH